MTPKQVVEKWIEAFNAGDAEAIGNLYADDATNHQVMNDPLVGKGSIRQMFFNEFSKYTMVCIPENIFEDRDWAILEWKDPKGLRGCGFFQVKNNKIVFQRGYWDKLSFFKLNDIPLPG